MFFEQKAVAARRYSGRGGCGCLGGVTLRDLDSERVGSGNLLGSGNLFNLTSHDAR